MSRFLGVIALLMALAVAYLYFDGAWDRVLNPGLSDKESTTQAPAVTEPDAAITAQARQHIGQITALPEQSISIERADHFVTADQLLDIPARQAVTSAALEEDSGDGVKTFGVDTGVISGTTSDIAAINLPEATRIKLQELLDVPATDGKQVYYIHSVNDGDEQGLWGILQNALTRTFAEGLELEGKKEKLYAEIPREADEMLNGTRSSFLGQVLQAKVKSTYIYNYRSGILGEDPNLIKPGQQLIIVSFSENELIRVYNHFINL